MITLSYIKIIFSACSIVSASLNTGDSSPRIENINKEEPSTIECQLVENGLNNFLCLIDLSPKQDKSRSKRKFDSLLIYKLAKVNEDTVILSNDTKSQIYHIQKSKAVYHERLLNKDKSQEKVCVGLVVEKK